MKKTLALLSLCFVGAASIPALDTALKKGDYETPHVKWDKPSKAGKIRALFFVPRYAKGRYAAEMAQRFDIEHEIALVNNQGYSDGAVPSEIAGAYEGEVRTEALLQQKWDAFVFWGVTPTKLLAGHKKIYSLFLLQVVREGAGVLVIDAMDDQLLKPQNRQADAESPLRGSVFATSFFSVGKGRGIQIYNFDYNDPEEIKLPVWGERGLLSKPPVLPYAEGWRDDYEARFRDLGMLLRHAVRREPPRLDISVEGGRVSVQGGWASPDCRLELFIAGEGEKHVVAADSRIVSGEKLSLPLPPLLPGRYQIGAIVRHDGATETFSGMAHKVAKDPSASISNLRLDKDHGDSPDVMTGGYELVGKTGDVVKLRLRDKSRRILEEKTIDGGKFEFRLEPWMPHLLTVEAALFRNGREIDRSYVYCRKTIRRNGKFEFAVWGTMPLEASRFDCAERLARLGVTSILEAGGDSVIRPSGTLCITTGSPIYVNPEDPSEAECWSNPEKWRRMEAGDYLNKKHSVSAQTGMKLKFQGDEGPAQIGCVSKHCNQAYRDFLKRKYETLEALNRSWKTDFSRWDDVGVSMIPEKNNGKDFVKYLQAVYGTLYNASINHAAPYYYSKHRPSGWGDLEKKHATNPASAKVYDALFIDQDAGSFLAGNYPRWHDRQCFRSQLQIGMVRKLGEMYRKDNPDILLSCSAMGWMDVGSDIDSMTKNYGFLAPYSDMIHNRFNEVVRSITPPTYISNTWSGYSKDPEEEVGRVWSDLMRKQTMILFWSVFSGPPAYYGVLKPDWSLYPPISMLLESTRKFREGLADSLIHSAPQNDKIAIYYSWPSVWGQSIDNGGAYLRMAESHDAAINFIVGLGRSFVYVTDAQLERGEVDLRRFEIVLMPRADAVSEKNARQFREYVRDGGRLIADVRSGLYDDSLNRRETGCFDDLFGVSRTGPSAPKQGGLNVTEGADRLFLLDSSVRVSTGKAGFQSVDGIPACVVAKHGKGSLMLLNFPFANLPPPAASENAVVKRVEECFSGIPTPFSFTMDGKPYRQLRCVSWKNGDMTIMAAFKANGAGGQVRCKLAGGAGHVYNISAEKDLGKTESFDFVLTPPHPTFFAVTDKPLPAVRLDVPDRVDAGTTIALGYGAPGMNALRPVRLKVESPAGTVLLDEQLQADGGVKKFEFRTALDDAPGKYKVTLKDIITSKLTTTEFTLRSKGEGK